MGTKLNRWLLGIFLSMLILSMDSCLASKAKSGPLNGSLQNAWSSVKAEVQRGAEIQKLDPAKDITLMETALSDPSELNYTAVPWSELSSWAKDGVQAALDAKEIGPGGAMELRERIDNMTDAVNVMKGQLL